MWNIAPKIKTLYACENFKMLYGGKNRPYVPLSHNLWYIKNNCVKMTSWVNLRMVN
jgi:hypothetical protein